MNFYLFIEVKKGGGGCMYICIDSWAKSAQGWIQGGAKIGPGGSLLQKTFSSDRKATCSNRLNA